jgi:hypothetical protein
MVGGQSAHLDAANRKMAADRGIDPADGSQYRDEGPFSYGFIGRMFHRMLEPP